MAKSKTLNPSNGLGKVVNSASSNFSAPHTYSVSINQSLAVGGQGYFIIVVNVSGTATTGHTVNINGSTNPVVFGFSTAPNVINSQTNSAGTKTISVSFNKQVDSSDNSVAVNANVICTVYPNPANTSFSFSFNNETNEKISAQLKDRSGNIMLIKSLYINKGSNTITMNVSQLTSGIYYLVVTGKEGSAPMQKQVIIQH